MSSSRPDSLRKRLPELVNHPIGWRRAVDRSRGLNGRMPHLSLDYIQRNRD